MRESIAGLSIELNFHTLGGRCQLHTYGTDYPNPNDYTMLVAYRRHSRTTLAAMFASVLENGYTLPGNRLRT